MAEITLYEYYLILKKYLSFIILVVILITGVTAVIIFKVKPLYETETSVIIPQRTSGIMPGVISGLSSELNEISFLPVLSILSRLGNTSSVNDYATILKSNLITKRVINSLRLYNYGEFNEKLRKIKKNKNKIDDLSYYCLFLKESVKIVLPDSKNNTLRVRVKLKDPEIAVKISDQFFIELKKYLEEINNEQFYKTRKFIIEKLKKVEERLKIAEEKLLNFKKQNSTVSLPEETKTYIKYLSDIEGEYLTSKIALKEINAKIKEATEKITDLKPNLTEVLTELKINKSGLDLRYKELQKAKIRYQSILNRLPYKALILARLEREEKLQNVLYTLLTQQLESLDIERSQEVESFRILDRAEIPIEPIFPKKTLIIGVSFLASLFLGIFLSLFINYWKFQKVRYKS